MNDMIDSLHLGEWKPVDLTLEEKRKFFYYCRYRAREAAGIALQLRKMFHATGSYENEIVQWLTVARDVFPLKGDGDSVNIEEIVNGREPVE